MKEKEGEEYCNKREKKQTWEFEGITVQEGTDCRGRKEENRKEKEAKLLPEEWKKGRKEIARAGEEGDTRERGIVCNGMKAKEVRECRSLAERRKETVTGRRTRRGLDKQTFLLFLPRAARECQKQSNILLVWTDGACQIKEKSYRFRKNVLTSSWSLCNRHLNLILHHSMHVFTLTFICLFLLILLYCADSSLLVRMCSSILRVLEGNTWIM